MNKCVGQPLLHRKAAPGCVFHLFRNTIAPIFLGHIEKPLGRVGAAVQQHILHRFTQRRRDILINRELARIDDAHIHTGMNGMEQKGRMHRFPHRLVATERE